jgi:hypothetical protein
VHFRLPIGHCGVLTGFSKDPIGNRQSKIGNAYGGEGGIRTHGGR